jgi:aspartate racemase
MKRKVVDNESKVPLMKRIGVIGGFGQMATLDVLERMFKYSALHVPQYGNRGYPSIDLRMVNRAPMKLNKDGSFPKISKPSPELFEAAKFVGKNADFIILPCNTVHLFAEEIEKTAGKPLLSIVDITVDEVIRRHCKRVGIMAIGLTLGKRLYQDPLAEKGIESVVLPKELSERLDNEGVYQIQEGATLAEINNVAHEAIEYLRKQKVDGIILGCTEIPILLGDVANDSDIINPSQLLAEAAVEKALVMGS